MTMPVAIVGIGCRLPGGADTPARFWEMLCRGVDAISEVPADRFDLDELFDPDPAAPGKISTRWGGFVDGVDRFDADFFGIAPREAKRMDPQHRLLLEVVWEALEDGGQVPERLGGTSTGVFIGISTHDYGDLHIAPGRRTQFDAHVNIGNALCAAPNRLSYLLDLRGPSMAIETACSSSLTAVHLACRSLEAGESTLAIAGGVNVILNPELTIGFSKATMMSPDGRCHAFDARANGYVRSEGAGAVILKPLVQALEDRDPIYALIRGTALNEDGRTSGISLPSGDAHEALLRQALRHADVPASALQYVEAHGTGTVAGDPVEAGALGRVLGQGRPVGGELLIGSVKTNIGHLEAGAGMAGLIKTALMLRHRRIPPSLHFRDPNPAIPFDDLGLRVPTELEPWPATDGPAMAGANSFGFGGANAHVILEQAPTPQSVTPADGTAGAQVLVLSARTERGLADAARRHRAYLDQGSAADLRDVCHTAAVRRSHHEHRLGVVGATAEEFVADLDLFLAGEGAAALTTGRRSRGRQPKLAFVFAGMGPQWWGMGQQLLASQPRFRAALEGYDRLLAPLSGWSLLDELTAGEAESRITDTHVAQVTNCAVQLALAELWRSWGVVPDAVVGHSAGELAAAHAAGALGLADTLTAAYHRGRLLHRATGTGTMLAAGISAEEAEALAAGSGGRVALAAVNGPTSVTLSGDAVVLEGIAASLERDGRFCRLLPVEVPYHGPQMDALRGDLLSALADLDPEPAGIPLVSGVTGTWVGEALLDGGHWWRSIRQPVRFASALDTLVDDGVELFVEISPHPALAYYVAECLAGHDVSGAVVPSLRRAEDERGTMLRSLAELHVRGREVDWAGVYPDGSCVPLPTYPWQRERHWLEPADPAATRSTGVDTGHPLLGRRLPTAHPVWEADLDDPRSDYLDAHVVDDSAVFPGAAYVDAALAAARQLHGDNAVALEGVEFRKLLFLGRPRDRRLQVVSSPRDASLEILSAPPGDGADWVLHACAVIRPHSGHATTATIDLDAVRARCTEEVPAAHYYAALQAFGFSYGSPFRGLEQTWTGPGEALARIGFPSDVELRVAAHEVHPALLDAGLQLLVVATGIPAAADGGASGPMFPVSIRRVVQHRRPGQRFWAHVQVREADGSGLEGDVTLVDDDGAVALACEGLRFTALDELETQPREEVESWLYELAWEQAPLDTPGGRRPAALRPAQAVSGMLEESGEDPEQDPGVATYHATVAPALNRIATGFAAAALSELGWVASQDSRGPGEEVAEALGVVPGHRRLLGSLLGAVHPGAEDGAPARDHDLLHRELDTLAERHPAFATEVALLRTGGQRLAEVLRGDADAREVLLGEKGLELIARLYHASPVTRTYHDLLGAAVAAAVGAAGAGAPPRVLEVGGGTGAATAAILPRLPDSAEYVFTDISPHFLPTARERFGQRPGMRFEVLDLETDPAAQGFEAHPFDVVVAANVLHTTADLRATLGNVARLLAPGGLLVVLELARRGIWFDLVFGLLEGWWRFRDRDVRAASPLLDADGWRALLEDCGFAPAAVPFASPDGRALQTVLLAHAPATAAITTASGVPTTVETPRSWLLFADAGGVAERLAATLRARGDACRLVRRGQAYREHADGVVEIPPDDAAAVQRLLADMAAGDRCDGVVHLWSLDIPAPDAMTATDLLESQGLGCGSVLALVQGFDAGDGPAPTLWLVTAGSQAVEGYDAAPQVAQAPLWGLGRVLMSEHAASRCRLVDLGPSCGPEEVAALADELRGEGEDEELALRGRERHVRRLQRSTLDGSAQPTTTRSASPDTEVFRLESDAAGTLERLQLREAAAVEPGPGEVAIRVRASGLTFRDVLKGLGMLPEAALAADPEPQAMGIECSGTVVACGPGVDELTPGDDVVALGWAAHGSRVVARASLTAPKPANVTFTQAASLANAFVTADYALNEVARIRPGERVLLHSAAGAVGLAAIQVCRRVGAEVLATAGTPEKRAHLADLGVEHVSDSRSLDFVHEVRRHTDGEGVDVVLNSLGGELLRASLDLLRPYGRFIELGKRDIYDDAQVGLLPFQRGLTFTAIDLIQLALDRPEHAKRLLAEALGRIEDGTYQPVPCTVFDLGEAEQAFRFMARARHIGKVVLTVDEPAYQVAPAGDLPPCRDDATYLITGGLGGFGLAVAAWLVDQGARSLVLMSRSGVAREGDEAALAALRASPATVHLVQGDAASEDDVARVLTDIRCDLPPLRGVLHAAMVLDDDAAVRLDQERFRAVLAPKIAGAWNLHRLTAEDTLDFFVLFSSIASVVGHPMQGNYAAANAFLDSLAAHRTALGLPALTVGWGAIADVGYVARHPEVAQYLGRGGFGGFSLPQALETLGTLLRSNRPHVIAALVDWPTLLAAYPVLAASRRFLAFAGGVADGDEAPAASHEAGPLSLLRGAPPEERRDVLERYLVERVARVLGSAAQKIDPERPLPEMGFDSLMAVELTTAIKTDLAVRLPVVKILQDSTCRGLAETILDELADDIDTEADTEDEVGAQDEADADADAAAHPAGPPPEAHPLSFEQTRLWFLQRLEPDNPAYNVPSAVRLTGPLDVAALQRSLRAVVERHEVLRARVHDVDGVPMQVFDAPTSVDLPVVDLSPLPERERAAELARKTTAATRVPFDLTTGPLLRASLLRLTETEHVFLLVVHHIACDAWSMNWVARELATLYEAFSAGAPSPLPPPAFRYVDHVRRERERLDDDLVASQLDYWKDQLAEAPAALQLPGIPDPPSRGGHRGAHQPFALSEDLTAGLEELSRREGVTLFTTLLAGFQVLLGRCSASNDVCVGTPVATRSEAGAETVVGCFMNTVVLRSDLSGDPTFRALLRRVSSVALDALAHQDVPFERVVEALRPERADDHAPLFQAMLVLHNARLPDLTVADLEISAVDVESGAAVADLALLLDVGERLSGTLEYRADRFDAATVDRFLARYRRLLEAAVAEPERRISTLPLLTPEERHTVVVEHNAGDVVEGGGGCLHAGFEAQTDRTPQATALLSAAGRLSYDQLDRRANQLAHHLRQLGVGPEVVVGVCLERSPEAVVAALAVLKAGGAYLPLAPAFPPARLRLMIEDAQAAVLLTQRHLLGRLPQHGSAVVTLDEEQDSIAEAPHDRPAGGAGPHNLAYVLYTSGSTGAPKGVLVEHQAISHQLAWRQHAFPLSDTDAVLQRTPLTFDPSMWELFGPLAAGARLIIPPVGSDADTASLARVIADQQITTLQVVPSVLEALLDEPAVASCRSLRRVLCGGEPLRGELRARFFATLPAELHNLYGPAEAAIDATHWACRRDEEESVVPIGRPVAHARIYLLDENLEPVPIGVPGHLHIGGRGLARGYLGLPQLTQEHFIPDPFCDAADARMFRTGDLGRWRPDGSIEFLGRIDQQVQLRGVRVEPGEIEAALVRHPAVREAAVLARPAPAGDSQLVGFIVVDGGAEPSPAAIQRFLAEQLPAVMVPSTISVLDGLSRTPNGKLDRKRLLERSSSEPSIIQVAARDEVEQRLVEIWERFFPGSAIGVTDDFFELGGHSLLAVRVLAHVHRELGVELPVSSLMQGRTIEQLARRLRAETGPPTPLVAVQPRGSRRPLFCMHPVSGSAFCYAALARALEEDRPLYALEAAGLHAGEDPHTRIEDMANHYLEAVRRVQPVGPYLLGGWSMGGAIAYEMARQLEAQGEAVHLLALLDARIDDGNGHDTAGDAALLRSFVESLGLSPDDLDGSAATFWQRPPDEQLAWVLEQARATELVPPDMELPALSRQLRVFTTNLRAMRDYTPARYSGSLTLFEAAETPQATRGDARWEGLALGGVRRYRVPGNHHTMLRGPAVDELARQLSACLGEADLVAS